MSFSRTKNRILSFPTILSEGNRLVIKELSTLERSEIYMPMIVSSQLTCLHLDVSGAFAGTLIDFVEHLPHLISLVVKSLSSLFKRDVSPEEKTTLRLVVQRKSITKVRLIEVDCLSEIHFLMHLCPSMQYFQIDNINDIDLQCVIRSILITSMKCFPSLFFLSFGCPKSKIAFLTRLDTMIAFEQLCSDYTIEQIEEKIYLRWTVCYRSLSLSNKRDRSPLLQFDETNHWRN